MRNIGIVRKVDELGRIVIPKELRTTMDIPEGTPMAIFVENNGDIVLRKYSSGCNFCRSMDNLKEVNGVSICEECANKIINAFKVSKGVR